MREVIYENCLDDVTIVDECSRKECLDVIDMLFYDAGGQVLPDDSYSIYVEYDDGLFFWTCDGDVAGHFRKTHIKGIIIDYYSSYLVYGVYRMAEGNILPELI